MKLIILLHFIVSALPPLDIYKIQFTSIDDQNISMSNFEGKRILVVSIKAPKAGVAEFKYLDSLQNAVSDLQIIIVPVIDEFRQTGKTAVSAAKRLLKSNVIVAQSSQVRKNAEKYQHPLFQWLTSASNNAHFDMDGKPGQYYLISAEGTLYGVLDNDAPHEVLEQFLQINFDETQKLINQPETYINETHS